MTWMARVGRGFEDLAERGRMLRALGTSMTSLVLLGRDKRNGPVAGTA